MATGDDAALLSSRYGPLREELRAAMEERDLLAEKLKIIENDLENEKSRRQKAEAKAASLNRGAHDEAVEREESTLNSMAQLEAQIHTAEKRVKDLEHKHAQEKERWEDDISLLREEVVSMKQLRVQVDKYKLKLEEMADVKKHCKELEETIEEITEEKQELEKQVNTLKPSLEQYKDRLAEKSSAVAQFHAENQQLTDDLARQQQLLADARQSLEFKENENREMREEMRSLQFSPREKEDASPYPIQNEGLRVAELIDKVSKLEREKDEILAAASGENEYTVGLAEKHQQTENELDDLRRMNEKLEDRIRAATARAQVLQRQKDAAETKLRDSDSGTTGTAIDHSAIEKENQHLRYQNEQQLKQLHEAHAAKDEIYAKLSALQKELFEERLDISNLQHQRERKDETIRWELEERYKSRIAELQQRLSSCESELRLATQRFQENQKQQQQQEKFMSCMFHRLGQFKCKEYLLNKNV
eukprot:GHVL01009225.1.p1 GENE.GHVL01009225.1~~GHVL01009225.1.p1  ORF type:complete len:476 (+),score=126.70 GHVL01009225.1:71-1498(+)